MFLAKVLQTIWARRAIVLVAMLSTMAGGVVVWKTLPPRYAAHSRVMLEVVKPDPITGQVLGTDTAEAYVRTQIELIRDYEVAGRVIDELGWLENPEFQAAYDTRTDGADMDIRRWAAQPIMLGTFATMVPDSNVLEISFRSTVPQNARVVADAVRRAYIQATIERRQAGNIATSEWYAQQAEKTRAALAKLEATKTELQRRTGVVLQARGRDMESDILRSVASVTSRPVAAAAPTTMRANQQLGELDAQISALAKSLGPNHPALQEAQRRRAALAVSAAAENEDARQSASRVDVQARAYINQLGAQTAKVVSQRDALAQAQALQDEIDLMRAQNESETQRSAKLRGDAEIAAAGVTPLGETSLPEAPEFPNPPLIMGGSMVLGGGVGVLLALLTELLGRKVRSSDDLESATRAPVLGNLPAPPRQRRTRLIGGARRKAPRPAKAVKPPKAAKPAKPAKAARVAGVPDAQPGEAL